MSNSCVLHSKVEHCISSVCGSRNVGICTQTPPYFVETELEDIKMEGWMHKSSACLHFAESRMCEDVP